VQCSIGKECVTLYAPDGTPLAEGTTLADNGIADGSLLSAIVPVAGFPQDCADQETL